VLPKATLRLAKAGVVLLAGLVAAALCASPARSAGDPAIAALQVALRAKRAYSGPVDGVEGVRTDNAIRRFQRRVGLTVDGVAGPRTRAALGPTWNRRVGSRVLGRGTRGWDVAELQFRLAWHGFPSGKFDGVFDAGTEEALVRFQRWAGIAADGLAGAATFAALAGPIPTAPYRLRRPLAAPITSPFGPRGVRFHAGVDMPSPVGTPVGAAAAGVVALAGRFGGGWGKLVGVDHSGGVRTLYAHLSRIDVRVGQRLAAGARLGAVGATGTHVTGPHLHFEVRVREAAVDPAPALY
jgi:murein DD-endopeptidase MepM/ murein hydrolase activator NlpD